MTRKREGVKEEVGKRMLKYGQDEWCSCVALLFPSTGVVLMLDNPCQTAVGDRDQIEMTDWSAAQTHSRTYTHTHTNTRKQTNAKKKDKKTFRYQASGSQSK